jgi:hypothetical protein
VPDEWRTGVWVAGIPLELAAVVGLFALAGGMIVIWALSSIVDVVGIMAESDLGRALGFLLLFALVVSAEVGAWLLGIAWLLYRRNRAGRWLAFVVVALVFFALAFGAEGSGWYTAAMLLALAAGILLALSPAVRDVFTGPGAPEADQPIAIVVARFVLIAWFADAVMGSSLYLLVGSFVSVRYAVYGALIAGGIAVGTYWVLRRIPTRDPRVRLAASVLAVAGVVLGAAGIEPVAFVCGIAVAVSLWLAPGGRAWFGDAPIRWQQGPPS